MKGQDNQSWVPRSARKQKDLVVPAYQQDHELVEWLTTFLGCSRAEAIRTAIRAFAGQMKAIDKDMRRGDVTKT